MILTNGKTYDNLLKILSFKLYSKSLQANQFYKYRQVKLLDQKISEKYRNLSAVSTKIDETNSTLLEKPSLLDSSLINCTLKKYIKEQYCEIQKTQENKFQPSESIMTFILVTQTKLYTTSAVQFFLSA